jgi:lipopolysaccharide transport system ATP-binding protein
MEPDILLVDEVLAVGDSEFQKKCLGKMDEITRKGGRTIFFVSHNMGAIRELCPKSILLENGAVTAFGETNSVIERYRSSKADSTHLKPQKIIATNTGEVRIDGVKLEDAQGKEIARAASGDKIRLVAEYSLTSKEKKSISVSFALINASTKEQIADLGGSESWSDAPNSGKLICTLPKLPLNAGIYGFNVCIRMNGFISYWIKEAALFEVVHGDFFGTGKLPDPGQGAFLIDQKWELSK